MRKEILLCTLALFAGLLCLANASPMNLKGQKKGPPLRSMGDSYTREEETFIVEKLLSSGKLIYEAKTWHEIADAHKKRRESGIPGFNNERTDMGLYRHFFKVMMKEGKRPKGTVRVPDSLRELLKPKAPRYTPQENAFIEMELLASPGTNLNNHTLWEHIAEKINLLEGTPGYPAARSARGLHAHFLRRLEKPHLLSDAIKKKYAQHLHKGGSSQVSSDANRQPTAPSSAAVTRSQPDNTQQQNTGTEENLSEENFTDDNYDFWAEMIEELREPEEGDEDLPLID